MNKTKDVIIIGSGVAGMTCALNLKRANLDVLIIEKNTYGGQMALSPKVENYPTVKSMSGMELSDLLFEQITDLGVEFELEDVLSVDKDENTSNEYKFTVKTDYNVYSAKSVIIASGVKHRHMGLPHEDELVGKGLSYCAICDGAFFENQDVCVVGDANTALQYALMLSKTSSKVYLCTLFDKFFSEKVYCDRVIKNDKIEVIHNISLFEFVIDDNDTLTGLKFKNTKTNEIINIDVNGVFIAIGQIPDNKRFDNLVDLTKNGYIVTNEYCETKTKGLFAIGDCRDKLIRQITTAASDGAIAAFYVQDYLNK